MEAALAAIFLGSEEAVLVAMAVFARVGAAVFMVPGLAERAVPVRVRLIAALGITTILSPLIAPLVDQAPATPVALAVLLMSEASIGLIIGFAFRLLIFALQTAGMIIAQHISIAQMFGAGIAPEPEPTISTLLSMGGVVLMMMAGLHVQLVTVLVGLYEVFPFGTFPLGPDVSEWAVSRVSETFALGVTLAAPFVAIGFTYNLALGALNRAMPQLLVALVGAPFLIWMGLVVLYHVIPGMFSRWDEALINVFLNPLAGLG